MGRPWRIFWALKLRIFRKFLGQMETGERPNCRFLACRWSKRLKRICRHVPWSYGQNHFCLQAHTTWNQLIEQNYFHQDWMSDDFQNISQLGLLFPVYGNIKNGPNHQPVYPWLHAYFHIPLPRFCFSRVSNWIRPKTGFIAKCHFITPSGKLTRLWKITIFNGKINYKWPCSRAILT